MASYAGFVSVSVSRLQVMAERTRKKVPTSETVRPHYGLASGGLCTDGTTVLPVHIYSPSIDAWRSGDTDVSVSSVSAVPMVDGDDDVAAPAPRREPEKRVLRALELQRLLATGEASFGMAETTTRTRTPHGGVSSVWSETVGGLSSDSGVTSAAYEETKTRQVFIREKISGVRSRRKDDSATKREADTATVLQRDVAALLPEPAAAARANVGSGGGPDTAPALASTLVKHMAESGHAAYKDFTENARITGAEVMGARQLYVSLASLREYTLLDKGRVPGLTIVDSMGSVVQVHMDKTRVLWAAILDADGSTEAVRFGAVSRTLWKAADYLAKRLSAGAFEATVVVQSPLLNGSQHMWGGAHQIPIEFMSADDRRLPFAPGVTPTDNIRFGRMTDSLVRPFVSKTLPFACVFHCLSSQRHCLSPVFSLPSCTKTVPFACVFHCRFSIGQCLSPVFSLPSFSETVPFACVFTAFVSTTPPFACVFQCMSSQTSNRRSFSSWRPSSNGSRAATRPLSVTNWTGSG